MYIVFFQSYALFTADDPLELTSCLQVVGGCGQMDSDQFCNLATESTASSHEKVVLNLVQDGKSYCMHKIIILNVYNVYVCMYVGIGLSELESFPVGVALPLWDSIVRCQERPPSSWPPAAYDLIGQ